MKKQIKNRAITKARFLYLYFVIAGIAMFVYAIGSLVLNFVDVINLPIWYTPLPIVFLLFWLLGVMAVNNYKMLWLYIFDTQQGRLMLNLTDNTHFSQAHKEKLVQWVYLRRNSIRNEMWLKLSQKVQDGIELTKDEKKKFKYEVRVCPQQMLDGINKAILINALIDAHKNISVLDDELREILELTDENMEKFNMSREINRCKKQEYAKNYDKLMEIGSQDLKIKNEQAN